MKFGLNLSAKKKQGPLARDKLPAPSQRNKALGDDSDDEPNDVIPPGKDYRAMVNQQLNSSSSMSKKMKEQHEKALEDDPTIFDYDAVYDKLKYAEQMVQEAERGKDDQKPRYIKNLLEMAEVRKRDRLLAEEKKVAREREAEGAEFADKEVFMTEAFKKQKEELERIEAEERKREELAEKTRSMDKYYKNELSKEEARHKAIMEIMANKDIAPEATPAKDTKSQDARLIEEAIRTGKEVIFNDRNEIVNKLDLLESGINIRPKFGSLGSLVNSDSRVRERFLEYEEYKRKKAAEYDARRRQGQNEREKLSQQVEDMIMEQKQKEKEEEDKKLQEQQQKAAVKRTSDDAAMSARERYLARKKQRQEEDASAAASSTT